MANLDTEVLEEPATDASFSSVEGDATKRRLRLWLLFAGHIVLGLLFSLWLAVEEKRPVEELLLIPVIGLMLAQTSLLGFWIVFSPARWWMRLAGLIMGIIYLEFLFGAGLLPDGLARLAAAMATGGIAAVFGLIRWRYADLCRVRQEAAQTDQEGLKFSIRGLMLFTFVVAVTIVGVKELPNLFVVPIPILSLCFVVVGLAGVWAGLGLARPMLRSLVVLLLAAVLGALLVYALNLDHWAGHFYFVTTMVLHAGILIASLLVIRSCGYRLVRKSTPDVEPLE